MRFGLYARTSLLTLALCTLCIGCIHASPTCCGPKLPVELGDPGQPAVIMSGYGHLHHSVTTNSSEAQAFFDQGLTLDYSFNFPEAYRSFRRASELDPHLAMAYWGMALALGPNYNDYDDRSLEKDALVPMAEAVNLKQYASPEEAAYIDALAHRFSADPKADLGKLDRTYSNAMKSVYKAYPDDPDAAVLYAESLMELHPWKLWTNDGKPAPGTKEIVSILEDVLKSNPDHLGANHFYIHAVEASPHPEKALACADRIPSLAEAAGHIVHMPSHIYMRIGDYESAATSNVAAIAADRAYFQLNGGETMYGMYMAHNASFLAAARCMEGRYDDARKAADLLADMGRRHIDVEPGAESLLDEPMLVMARFHHWDEIKALPEPDRKYKIDHAYWVYATGLAAAAARDVKTTDYRSEVLDSVADQASIQVGMAANSDRDILEIARWILDAADARVNQRRWVEIDDLTKAVALQDKLAYDEPEDFYYPARESLGSAMLRAGDFIDADAVFRKELTVHPNSGRALCGLETALLGERNGAEALKIQAEFVNAWAHADSNIEAQNL